MFPEAISGVVVAGAGLLAYAVRGPSSSLLAPSIARGSSASPHVALTFDDGPAESTPALLDILARQNVRATFFFCGANVRRLPGVARAAAEAGHEIGNHSDTHPNFAFSSRARIHCEIAGAQRTIEQALGRRATVFRPPFGVRWFGMRSVLRELDLHCIMWTIIGRDWKLPAGRIVRRVLRAARPGAIICLHDGRRLTPHPDVSNTIEAVQLLVPALRRRGLEFMTISELIWRRN